MKVDTVTIEQIGEHFLVKLNDIPLEDVTQYKIKSSASGTTELEIRLRISGNVKDFTLSTN